MKKMNKKGQIEYVLGVPFRFIVIGLLVALLVFFLVKFLISGSGFVRMFGG